MAGNINISDFKVAEPKTISKETLDLYADAMNDFVIGMLKGLCTSADSVNADRNMVFDSVANLLFLRRTSEGRGLPDILTNIAKCDTLTGADEDVKHDLSQLSCIVGVTDAAWTSLNLFTKVRNFDHDTFLNYAISLIGDLVSISDISAFEFDEQPKEAESDEC